MAMVTHASLPMNFWDEACFTSVYLINKLPSNVLFDLSPFEIFFRTKLDYHYLKVSRCLCYPCLIPYNDHKLQPKSTPYIFLGYSLRHKGYIVFLRRAYLMLVVMSFLMNTNFLFHFPTNLHQSMTKFYPPKQLYPLLLHLSTLISLVITCLTRFTHDNWYYPCHLITIRYCPSNSYISIIIFFPFSSYSQQHNFPYLFNA